MSDIEVFYICGTVIMVAFLGFMALTVWVSK